MNFKINDTVTWLPNSLSYQRLVKYYGKGPFKVYEKWEPTGI